MKKFLGSLFIVAISSLAFANNDGLGIVSDEDFKKVGVTQENIDKAKGMVGKVSTNYKMLLLEKKQLELEVNKYVLDGAEQNLAEIDILFDKMGQIEANILKDRIRSQIEMQKYITQEQYMRARDIAIRRINEERSKKK